MEYRKAREEEIDEIIAMKNEVKQRIIAERLPIWLDGYPLDSFIIEDIQSGFGRVVVDQGKIVAYACYHRAEVEYPIDTFLKDNLMSFGRVMVRTGYTGKNYGGYLVESMIEETKQLKKNGLGILADACNTRAIHLYEKYGFKKEGSRQFEYAYLDIYGLYF